MNSKEKKIEVTFFPYGKKVTFSHFLNLKKAILKAGIPFSFPCGGKGICGKCKVKVRGNVTPLTVIEKEKLSVREIEENYRLACQTGLKGDTQVEILLSDSVFSPQILTTWKKEEFEVKSPVKKIYLSIKPPDIKDQISDVSRIRRELKKRGFDDLKIGIEVVKKIPSVLRENEFKVTVVIDDNEIICIEGKDTRKESFGIAFDIGTTTIVVALLDLTKGKVIATKGIVNPQSVYGYDVISRISYIQQKGKKGILELQKAVILGVNRLIDNLLKEANIDKSKVYKIVFVGNTIMQHILVGIDPVNIGLYPYVPVIQEFIKLKSFNLKLRVNPFADVFVFPNIAGFIGGDTVGVILSTGIHRAKGKNILAVDLGTNGEIVLSSKGKIWATSTAAGPAFEGVRISQGMMAQRGAIERVKIEDGRIFVKVVGDVEPEGICGSGLIDAVAELHKEGVIDDSGKITPRDMQKDIWKERVLEEEERKFVLVEKNDYPIFITQKDVRELQLAKAAVSTGIKILLKKTGIKPGDVQQVFIAGGFGSYLNLQNACNIGLFPLFPRAEVKNIGNAALHGAIKALLSQRYIEEVKKIPYLVSSVELATHPEFQNVLAESIRF